MRERSPYGVYRVGPVPTTSSDSRSPSTCTTTKWMRVLGGRRARPHRMFEAYFRAGAGGEIDAHVGFAAIGVDRRAAAARDHVVATVTAGGSV